jgi:hypothetical protein
MPGPDAFLGPLRCRSHSETRDPSGTSSRTSSTAEQRAAKASAQADQTRRDADAHARQLVSNAKKNADQIVTAAKAQADQLHAETKADAERRRAAAQREVDELTRQKDSIATHLAQVRQLLDGQMPGMDPAPPKPAIVAGAAPSGAPSNGTSGQPAPTTVTPLLPAPPIAPRTDSGSCTNPRHRPPGLGTTDQRLLGDPVVSHLDAVLLSPGEDLRPTPVGPPQLSIAGELAHLRHAECLPDLISQQRTGGYESGTRLRKVVQCRCRLRDWWLRYQSRGTA